MALPNGFTIRKVPTWSHTEINREGLIAFIRHHPDATRVDPETGEVQEVPWAFAELLLKCFRQEPRWRQLEGLGLETDEYCKLEFVPSVLTTAPEPAESDSSGGGA